MEYLSIALKGTMIITNPELTQRHGLANRIQKSLMNTDAEWLIYVKTNEKDT